MSKQTILITGGAGFVGSHLCIFLKQAFADADVIALDNLKRRGSELNLPRLQQHGVRFVHGDVRHLSDLEVPQLDWLIECSAEPSVHAGVNGSTAYLVDTNLQGAINCLELVKQHQAKMIFLSSSRIYPIEGLRTLPLEPVNNAFSIPQNQSGLGWSQLGISESFPLTGARSLYGSTKLSAELFIEEYHASFAIDYVINRCGVIAGPWQMGKVDQGFVTLWLARHLWGQDLAYFGFGGEGLQVRDVLHVADLCTLIHQQIQSFDKVKGQIFNVGGGIERATSLCNLTETVQNMVGRQCTISRQPETKSVDIPYYVADNSKITQTLGWTPAHSLERLLEQTHQWLRAEEALVKPIFSA